MASEKSTSATARRIHNEVKSAEAALKAAIDSLKNAQDLINAEEDFPRDHTAVLENLTGMLKVAKRAVSPEVNMWLDRVEGRKGL